MNLASRLSAFTPRLLLWILATSTPTIYSQPPHAQLPAAADGQWSDVVTNCTSAKTDPAGRLVLASPKTKKTGTLSATIANVTLPSGRQYDAAIYNEPLVRVVTLK